MMKIKHALRCVFPEKEDRTLKYSFLFTFALGLTAYGYAFFNGLFSYDNLQYLPMPPRKAGSLRWVGFSFPFTVLFGEVLTPLCLSSFRHLLGYRLRYTFAVGFPALRNCTVCSATPAIWQRLPAHRLKSITALF